MKRKALALIVTISSLLGLSMFFSLAQADSSLVGTSTTYMAPIYPIQRKAFYAVGRFWSFYSDGSNAIFRTSTDGSTWTTPTILLATSDGSAFSVWFDGTYVHYAIDSNFILYYRRGVPNSDGTITWSAAVQTIYSGSSTNSYAYPVIAVDSGGYAWVGTRHSDDKPYVLKNEKNDGTWSTASGFPYQLTTQAYVSWRVLPVPLTSSKVYVIYCATYVLPKGKLYNSTWGSEESDLADYALEDGYGFTAVAQGDNVHFAYNRDTYEFRYNKRTYGTGWGVNDVHVYSSTELNSVPALSIDITTGTLFCFWVKTSTDFVYYKKCINGTWDTNPTNWINESADGIPDNDLLNSFYQTYGGYIGLLYTTKTTSPYNVKFAYLTPLVPPTNDDLTLDLTGATYKGNKTLLTAKQDYKFVLKVTDNDGVTNLLYSEIRLDPTAKNIVLRATKGSGDTWSFSEQSDPSNYVTLNVGASSHSTSGNQKTFNFLVKMNWNWDDAGEALGVQAYSKDQDDFSDTDNYSNIFGVENDLSSSSLTVSDSNRVNPNQALTMSGYWYYEGTSVYPPDGNYEVKIKLSGVQVGSTDTTLVNGEFSIDISAKSTVGSYSYSVEATYMTSPGSFGSVIVDRLEVFWYSTSDGRADINSNVDYRWKLRYEYDELVFDSTKGTVSIGGSLATWDGNNNWWYRTVALPSTPQSYSQDLTFSDTTHGLTTVVGTTSQSVIADRFEFVSIAVDDSRINVGGSFELRYQIRYDYDDFTFSSSKGTVFGFTWDSTDNRWEKVVTGSSSVCSTNYDETYVSISDTTYGLTAKQDVAGVDVITDRVEVYYQAIDDSRLNVGSNIEFRVKARLDYDDHELGSGDSLSSNFGSLTWDASNLWFDGVRNQPSAGNFSFSTASASESSYTITAIYIGVSNPLGIYDRIMVTISANATNPSVGQTVEFTVSAKYEYDNSDITTLSFQVTRNASNYATSTPFTDMQTGEVVYNYTTSSASETTYGLSAFSTNTVTVQWGGLFIEGWQIIVDDSHADCSSNVYLRWALRYSSNQSAVPSGTIWVNGTSHSITSGWANFTVTLSTVGIRTYAQTDIDVNGEHDYGQIPSNPTIVWDRIKITEGGVSDSRCNYGSTQTVWFKAIYEYDSATFQSEKGTLYVNGSAMTWVSTNFRWEKTYAYSSVVTYLFQVSAVDDTTYGLTVINNVAGDKEIIWDRIKITNGGVIDSRVDYGTTGKIWFQASWEYDSVSFETGNGIVYVNSSATTWNPTYTRWEVELTYFNIANYTFKVSSIMDNTHGISVLNDLAGGKWLVWDRLKCVSVTANDTRIDIGGDFELRYQIQYEYDSVSFTSSQGSVSNFTWDEGNGYWKKNVVGSSSVTSTNYDETDIVITDSTYDLTVKTDVSGINIITDRFEIYYISVTDNRINIGSPFELRYKVRYDYDNVIFSSTKGSVLGFTWDSVNFYWKKEVSGNSTATSTNYDETYLSIIDSTYGLSAKENISGVNVITDGLKVSAHQIDLANKQVTLRLLYAYDDSPIENGNVTFSNLYAVTNSSGWATFSLDSFPDFLWGQTAYGVKDSLYDITYKFQNETIPLTKMANILVETETGLTLSDPIYQSSQLFMTLSGSGSKYVKVAAPKPYYVKIGTLICIEGTKWTYNTLACYTEITESYSTQTILVSWVPLSPGTEGSSGPPIIPKTTEQLVAETISTALFVLSSNYVGVFVFILSLVGFVLAYRYEQKTLGAILGIAMFYLLFDLITVFILKPQQLFPPDLLFLEPLLWVPPTIALDIFGPLAVQQFIQVAMMGSLFAILVAAVYGVTQR